MPLALITLHDLGLGYERLGLPMLLLSLIIRFSISNTTSLLYHASSHTLLSMPCLKIFHLKHHQSITTHFFMHVIINALSYFDCANFIHDILVAHPLYMYHILDSLSFYDHEVANISNIYSMLLRSFYTLHHIDMSLIAPSSLHLYFHATYILSLPSNHLYIF